MKKLLVILLMLPVLLAAQEPIKLDSLKEMNITKTKQLQQLVFADLETFEYAQGMWSALKFKEMKDNAFALGLVGAVIAGVSIPALAGGGIVAGGVVMFVSALVSFEANRYISKAFKRPWAAQGVEGYIINRSRF